MKPTTALACFLATCAAAVAQSQTLVIPVGAATTEGNTSNLFPWGRGGNGLRLQCVYDSANFTAQGVAGPITITQLSWRPDAGTPRTWLATNYQTTTIRLSTSPLDYGSASTTFANNVGADETTVYSGPISWPAGSSSAPGPAPFLVTVPLATPFVYDPTQGDLNVDIDLPVQAFSGTNLQFDASTVSPQASRVYVSTGYPSGPASFQNNHGMVLQVGYSPVVQTQPLTPGNMVAVRVGDGVTPLTAAAAPVFLDEYTVGGVLVQSIALPTTSSGGQHACTQSGVSATEGIITQSVDGRYLMVTGFDAPPGTANVAATPSTSVPRVIARIGMDGSVDTSTGLTNAFSLGALVSAVSPDGAEYWLVGSTGSAATASGGVRHTVHGASSSTSVSSAILDGTAALVSGNQLFVTEAGPNPGVYAIGSNLSSTSGQSAALMVPNGGMVRGGGHNPWPPPPNPCFPIAEYDTLMAMDQSGQCHWRHVKLTTCGATVHDTVRPCYDGNGGWGGNGSHDNSYWYVSPGHIDMGQFGSAATPSPWVVQNGVDFRSIREAMQPPVMQVVGFGCSGSSGVPLLSSTLLPYVAGSASLQLANLPLNVGVFALSLAPGLLVDLGVLGAPGCSLFQSPDVLSAVIGSSGVASYSLSVPYLPSLVGLQIRAQGVSLDPAANALGLTTSNGLVATIGW